MDFSKALRKLHFGKGIRLPHWEKSVIVIAQFPDENSKMTAPYLYVESQYGRVPWIPNFPEIFNDKWESVEINHEQIKASNDEENYDDDGDWNETDGKLV